MGTVGKLLRNWGECHNMKLLPVIEVGNKGWKLKSGISRESLPNY